MICGLGFVWGHRVTSLLEFRSYNFLSPMSSRSGQASHSLGEDGYLIIGMVWFQIQSDVMNGTRSGGGTGRRVQHCIRQRRRVNLSQPSTNHPITTSELGLDVELWGNLMPCFLWWCVLCDVMWVITCRYPLLSIATRSLKLECECHFEVIGEDRKIVTSTMIVLDIKLTGDGDEMRWR